MADPILEMANERESDTDDLKSKLIEQNFRVYAAILQKAYQQDSVE